MKTKRITIAIVRKEGQQQRHEPIELSLLPLYDQHVQLAVMTLLEGDTSPGRTYTIKTIAHADGSQRVADYSVSLEHAMRSTPTIRTVIQ